LGILKSTAQDLAGAFPARELNQFVGAITHMRNHNLLVNLYNYSGAQRRTAK
jgi:hypothetical protein